MRYTVQDGIHVVEIPVGDFKIEMVDAYKKSAAQSNYCNAGFFAVYHEEGQAFTLPVGHLVCDYGAKSPFVQKYCTERGSFSGNKFRFDSGFWSYQNPTHGKNVSTLVVDNGKASIVDICDLPDGVDYAISGVPVMRDGADVKFATYVKGQGWGGSSLYATQHIFVGLKKESDMIYILSMKTKTYNMVLTAEAYRKFKALGMYDVIKLDGGGSAYLNIDGKAVVCTSGNRRVNSIIHFGPMEREEDTGKKVNPYSIPTMVLKQWNKYKEATKWLQWQLTAAGYQCDVDGCFGGGTLKQVKAFQKAHSLDVDGMVGPATREALLNAV